MGIRRPIRAGLMAAIGVLALSGPALAGELKFGAKPFEVDGSGNLTQAARASAVTEVEAQPGDEVWLLHMWAQIDKPADGPLYIEFYRDRSGKALVAHRHEYVEYAGDKFVSIDLEVGREEGFKPGDTVEVAFVQNVGGKDVKKAKSKLTFKASSQRPAPTPEPESDDEGEDDEEGGEDEGDDGAPDESTTPEPSGPPPVPAGDKKGCSIGAPPSAWLPLLLVAGVPIRRRVRRIGDG